MRSILAGFNLLLLVGGPTGSDEVGTGGTVAIIALILFAILAIAVSFICSVAEAVLLSVTPSYIATLQERQPKTAGLLERLKGNIDRPLAAILSLNTIAHTVGAAGVGAEAAEIWGSQALGWVSAAMTLMILVLSEIIPKTLGALYWRPLAPWTARLVRVLIWGLFPLVLISEMITRLLAGKRREVVTREEVAAMAALSHEGGQLESQESRILANLFRLRALCAHDILTPRPVMIAYAQDMTAGEVLQERPNVPVSRIPIYDGTIDKVTGFVLKNDILLAQANDKPQTPLRELRREIKAVAGETPLSELFEILLQQRAHLALVIDEYGGTDGLVTMEDLIETLLGTEIVDEADTTPDMQRLARRQWERRAKALGLEIHEGRDGNRRTSDGAGASARAEHGDSSDKSDRRHEPPRAG